MATKKHTCFTVTCDECKDQYENCDSVILHFDSAEEALSEAKSCDWQCLPDERLICDRCVAVLEERGDIERDDTYGFAYRLTSSAPTSA